MSLYEGRAGSVVMAATITSILFVIGFQISAPFMPLYITLTAAAFLVFTPALIGISAVMIPVEAVVRRFSPSLSPLAVVASNCLIVWAAGFLLPADMRRGSTITPTFYIGFAAVGALVWLACDRFYKRVASDA